MASMDLPHYSGLIVLAVAVVGVLAAAIAYASARQPR
jgi:hypothetical protein